MKRQYAVMILVEEQELDEEGEVDVASEAREPITLANVGTLEEAEEYLAQVRESVEA